MSAEVVIDDPDDPRLADYAGLSDAALRTRVEGPPEAAFAGATRRRRSVAEGASRDGPAGAASAYGRFVAEGFLAVAALAGSPYRMRSVLVSEAKRSRLAELGPLPDEVTIYIAPQAVLERTVGFKLHRGLVAVGERRAAIDPDEMIAAAGGHTLLVLEGLNDHENLGVVFRNASAFGVGGVLLDPRCADPLYRRCVRVSLGHVLAVPFARVPAGRWPAILDDLARAGYETVALSPGGDVDLLSWHPAGPGVALLVGAEGPGVSQQALAAAGRRVRIGMAPGVDSLNVATATGIALHWLVFASGRQGPDAVAPSSRSRTGG